MPRTSEAFWLVKLELPQVAREVESIISCTNPKQQGFCRGNTAEYKESRIRFMESLLAKVHPHSREQL